MRLISTLRPSTSLESKKEVISENCSLGQAMIMIENWCYDNDADYPTIADVWKVEGNIRVQVRTHGNKYINIFDIKE